MADSIRQQIREAIMTALRAIRTGTQIQSGMFQHTYKTNAGAKVFDDPEGVSDQTATPFLVVRFGRATINRDEGVEYGRHEHLLPVEILGYVAKKSADQALDETDDVIADVMACLWVNRKLGGLARWIDTDEAEIEPVQGEQVLASLRVNASIRYVTALGKV